MAWNDNKNPWGDKQNTTPPELDEVIKDFKNKFEGILEAVNHQVVLKKLFRFLRPKEDLNT